MTPQEFIAKWRPSKLKERQGSQEHFIDLCAMLGQDTPATADSDAEWYCFERGATKLDGENGWADVWMRGHFGWEYKGKHKDLKAAYDQLLQYRESLENPPLLVVCDMNKFEVHTNFTGTAKQIHHFDLEGLADPNNLKVLRHLFTEPDALRPGQTTENVTEDVAKHFEKLAYGMRDRGIPAQDAAHFLMKLMFCMFAEDIKLLPAEAFSRTLKTCKDNPKQLSIVLKNLFETMATGGMFGADAVLYFNGGLFADSSTIDLTKDEIAILADATIPDWGSVEPHIFGTLFERTLDPSKRAQIGAHYTSSDDIKTLLEPVMIVPLRREWEAVREKCLKLVPKLSAEAKKKGARTWGDSKPRRAFEKQVRGFLDRLAEVTVLDPACGSGNFLYVALRSLLDLEKEVFTFAATYGISMLPEVRPTQLHGIEINAFAQELAQVVIWIGYLQWMRDNGFNPPRDPVLDPIESIEHRDAILDLSDPTNPQEPTWPAADFIVGNPPFLGSSDFRERDIPDDYVEAMRTVYKLHGKSDLCCYWFERSRRYLVNHKESRIGLLATQAIRKGGSRNVLELIDRDGEIFFAESDRPWINDGASVRVSMIGFHRHKTRKALLDGSPCQHINADLTAGLDLTNVPRLLANDGKSFEGDQKGDPFDAELRVFLPILVQPNPNGRPNSDVIIPRAIAEDLTKRNQPLGWVIDFGVDAGESAASRYEGPFEYLATTFKNKKVGRKRKTERKKWWIHKCPRPELRKAISCIARFIVTPRVGKHRVFCWLGAPVLPDSRLFVFAFDDDFSFGVLHSKIHESWALRQGARHGHGKKGGRPTYNNRVCFETFPFPDPTDEQRETIAEAARELDKLRSNWLNPPEWTRTETLTFPGSADGPWARYVQDADGNGIGTVLYPRVVPKDDTAANKLKKQTLTNLYNQRPTWLDLAHKRLDEAVFAAYGWPTSLSDDELLAKLLELNLNKQAAK